MEYPAPFADDEEESRFSRLITDIIHSRDDYAARLGALSLAALTAEKEREERDGEDSARAIIKAVSGGEQTGAGGEINRRWQARLILALGEFLDAEQEAVDNELARIEENSRELFNELHGGEEGEEFANRVDVSAVSASRAEHTAHTRSRINAWQTLFGNFQGDGGTRRALLTQSLEAAAIYEERGGMVRQILLPSSLTGEGAENMESVCGRLHDFHRRYGTEVSEFAAQARDIMVKEMPIEEVFAAEFPPEKYGRSMAYILL